jgi:hypothetical protein
VVIPVTPGEAASGDKISVLAEGNEADVGDFEFTLTVSGYFAPCADDMAAC